MSKQNVSAIRELTAAEREIVSGGMKWERGHVSPNVIDARGGQIHTWFGTFTLDVHGKISSYTPN
jgi:hypothetical protein